MAKSACEDQCGRSMLSDLNCSMENKSATFFRQDVESLTLLHGLCLKNAAERNQALQQFFRITDDWFEGYGSPICNRSRGYAETADCCTVLDRRQKLQLLLPDILQMAMQCPFKDVQDSLFSLLNNFRDRGMKMPRPTTSSPSYFIPFSELIPVTTDDVERHSEFSTAFLQNYGLDHVTQVLGFHPRYLRAFQAMRQFLLQGEGPLPADQRQYIAIMAAARHHCSYLVYQAATGFLLSDGNPVWLRGIDHASQRMRNLAELNKLMAHRPWLIRKSHFEKLLRGADSWSLSELVHAVVILAHFHALSSFVHGCGLTPEISHVDGHTYGSGSALAPEQHALITKKGSFDELAADGFGVQPKQGSLDVLVECMMSIAKEDDKLPLSEEELLSNFQTVESQIAELPAGAVRLSPKADILCFVEDPDFTYQDFAKRGIPQEIPTFRAEDYSWEDQGYSLISKLYQNMGELLDDKFKIACSLTYRTMGDKKDVDTSVLRRAVWYYIQTLFGIRHDDYDYIVINRLLERNLKAYMKTVTCYPERITKRDYDSCMRDFKHSEKVHVNIMLMEARLQAEMLYTLRALAKYMT